MDFDGSGITENNEVLSNEEKKLKLAELLSSPLAEESVKKNLSLLCWGARQCLKTTAGEFGGTTNQPLVPQEMLAQDVPDKYMNKGEVYEAITHARDLSQVGILKKMGGIKPKDLPDGIYKDINIFQGDRTEYFTEEQKEIWKKENMNTPDEGLAVHPIYDENNFLTDIKVFWHGHRNNLIVRTISTAEMITCTKEGTFINIDDNWPVRKL